MKKLIINLLSIHLSLFTFLSFSQSCLPEGITFTNQEEIDNFQTDYPNCTEIEGDVLIHGNNITSLNGLIVLTDIDGHFDIQFTNLLNLNGLDNLQFIGGRLTILENDMLSLLSGLENLTEIGGQLAIENCQVTNMTGLNSLSFIGLTLTITNITSLISITGLENLISIGGILAVTMNPLLADFSGLDNLTYIGSDVLVGFNNALLNFNGLNNLISIGGDFRIYGNNSLENFSGLNNLNSVNGYIDIHSHEALVSVIGLENIEAGTIESLYLYNNNSLNYCHINSVCNYLVTPIGEIQIHDNAQGCNSIEEVEEACWTSVDEIVVVEHFSISPNPNSGSSNLRFKINEQGLVICDLYEISGVKIKTLLNENRSPGTYEMEIDLSDIPAGVYFCVLKTNQGILNRKIIKTK